MQDYIPDDQEPWQIPGEQAPEQKLEEPLKRLREEFERPAEDKVEKTAERKRGVKKVSGTDSVSSCKIC